MCIIHNCLIYQFLIPFTIRKNNFLVGKYFIEFSNYYNSFCKVKNKKQNMYFKIETNKTITVTAQRYIRASSDLKEHTFLRNSPFPPTI